MATTRSRSTRGAKTPGAAEEAVSDHESESGLDLYLDESEAGDVSYTPARGSKPKATAQRGRGRGRGRGAAAFPFEANQQVYI